LRGSENTAETDEDAQGGRRKKPRRPLVRKLASWLNEKIKRVCALKSKLV